MTYEKTEWKDGDIITAEKLNHIETGVEEINMSYEKNKWNDGDIITAEKLNHLEDGVGNNFIINVEYDVDNKTATSDKTHEEIVSAIQNGHEVWINLVRFYLMHGTNFYSTYIMRASFGSAGEKLNVDYVYGNCYSVRKSGSTSIVVTFRNVIITPNGDIIVEEQPVSLNVESTDA